MHIIFVFGLVHSGAFVDIAGQVNDSQAFELERRTIQSAYLLRSQESGSIMPQESGLLYNSCKFIP